MRWLNGKELIDRWGVKDFELVDYIRNGLAPYDRFGRPLRRPSGPKYDIKPDEEQRERDEIDPQERHETIKVEVIDDVPCKAEYSWKYFRLPLQEDAVEKKISEIMEWNFKLEDVEEFENKPVIELYDDGIFGEPISRTVKNKVYVEKRISARDEKESLTAQEKRDYGRLQLKEKEWKKILDAAVYAMHFCIQQKEKTEKPITKNAFYYALDREFKEDKISITAMEDIRKAIRDRFPQYLKSAGRPSQKNV